MDWTFEGFEEPKSNYFKMPNDWTNITSKITSLAELKVVEYVLRHTWGFQEYGGDKCITIDEFMHGRKNKDGERMDSGTGLSNRGTIDGLRYAVQHNLLTVRTRGKDLGRAKKYYGLSMCRMLTPDVRDSHTTYENLSHRSEKDTLERNIERHSPSANRGESRVRNDGFLPSANSDPVDEEYSRKLRLALLEKGKLVGKRVSIKAWGDQFRILRTYYDEETIEQVLDWYCERIGQEFVPVVHSAGSFKSKFILLQCAVHRSRNGKGVWDVLSARVTRAAKKLAKELESDYSWPKGSADRLPFLIQQMVDRYGIVRKSLYKFGANKTNQVKNRRFAKRVYSILPQEYVRQWFDWINRQIRNWDDWSGSMAMFEFSMTHKHFRQFVASELKSEGKVVSDSDWDLLMEIVKDES